MLENSYPSNFDEPDNDDDDWFFSSFQRYNELQMFDFPSAVQGMDLTSTNNLCVSLDESGKNYNEIMIFSLPPSLHKNKSMEDLKLDRHLALDHGYFTSSRLQQTKCVPNEEKLFISEDAGVALYDISSSESDIIKKLADVPGIAPGSRLAVNGVNRYLACSSATNNLKVVVNYESMNMMLSIDDDCTDAKNLVLPLFSSSNIVSFGDTVTGQITSYDVRDGKHLNTVNISGVSAHWQFNTLFNINQGTEDSHEIFLFSTVGDFLIYDIRKSSCPVTRAKHSLGCANKSAANNLQMNVCPANTKRFSVCGFDENVYVCELNGNEINVQFTHDGHSYNADEFEPNVLTLCSLWLPFVSENTIVSCGSNCSVQCWQFKIPSG